ncbi:hypothetical protein, partial [Bifidobacterium breve]|uniref:hypothetical protein n=1 Tax=Bifidobacterium breve TaxID=1685 RepID=UPI001F2DC775
SKACRPYLIFSHNTAALPLGIKPNQHGVSKRLLFAKKVFIIANPCNNECQRSLFGAKSHQTDNRGTFDRSNMQTFPLIDSYRTVNRLHHERIFTGVIQRQINA